MIPNIDITLLCSELARTITLQGIGTSTPHNHHQSFPHQLYTRYKRYLYHRLYELRKLSKSFNDANMQRSLRALLQMNCSAFASATLFHLGTAFAVWDELCDKVFDNDS